MIPRRCCEISDKNRIFILFILHPVGVVLLKRCIHCPLGSILLHKHHLHFEPSAAFTRVRPLFSSYKQIFFLATRSGGTSWFSQDCTKRLETPLVVIQRFTNKK